MPLRKFGEGVIVPDESISKTADWASRRSTEDWTDEDQDELEEENKRADADDES